MRTRFLLLLACVTALCFGQATLTNDSIVKMVKDGLSENTILNSINAHPGKYATGANDLVALKSAGVSDRIISAMNTRGCDVSDIQSMDLQARRKEMDRLSQMTMNELQAKAHDLGVQAGPARTKVYEYQAAIAREGPGAGGVHCQDKHNAAEILVGIQDEQAIVSAAISAKTLAQKRQRAEEQAASRHCSPLGLRVERTTDGLLLTWNRDAVAFQNASKVVLLITDGERHEDIEMDRNQVRTGGVVYPPISGHVNFLMEVADANPSKEPLSESLDMPDSRPSPLAPCIDPTVATEKSLAAMRVRFAATPYGMRLYDGFITHFGARYKGQALLPTEKAAIEKGLQAAAHCFVGKLAIEPLNEDIKAAFDIMIRKLNGAAINNDIVNQMVVGATMVCLPELQQTVETEVNRRLGKQ